MCSVLSQKIRPTGKLVITLRFETYGPDGHGGVGLRGPRGPGARRRGRGRLRALDMFILGSRPAPESPSPFHYPARPPLMFN